MVYISGRLQRTVAINFSNFRQPPVRLLFPPGARVINVPTRTAAVLTSVVEKTYIPHLTGVVFEDQPIPAPLALPW